MTESANSEFVEQLDRFLLDHSLSVPGEKTRWIPLSGGVSSDIWRVDLAGRSICVKRALPELRVSSHWEAPIARNSNEWAWLCFAFAQQPHAVPQPLAHDPKAGLFAMAYLPTAEFPVWKNALMDGRIDPRDASELGRVVATLHNASALRADLAQTFDTLEIFTALRLNPYFLATGDRHPQLSSRLREIAGQTAKRCVALVHGDVSPKNILLGPSGPVILDAECAWYGDPAFDLAFCLTHLLLKTLARPDCTGAYLNCFDALSTSYLNLIRFERRDRLESRAACLLPALLLARIDGKSPVEYLVGRAQQQQWVRDFTIPRISVSPDRLSDIAEHWRRQLGVLPVGETTS
jgi:aminoglycoside phosphotransferase (APT) family kinase protein